MAREIGQYLDPIINPGGVSFLMKRGTIDFIEDAYQEGIAQSIIQNLGQLNYGGAECHILYGCVESVVGGNTTISSGAIFYRGEIFLCVGQTFSNPTGGNVVVANLNDVSWQPTDAVGNFYADPQQFNGASNSNIHHIRTVVFASGTSGSGTLNGTTACDFINFINISGYNPIRTFGSGVANFGTPYYNAGFRIVGNTCFMCGVLACTSITSSVALVQLSTWLGTIAPTMKTKVIVLCDGGLSSYNEITIDTSGNLNFNSGGGLSGNIYLDGISFRIN